MLRRDFLKLIGVAAAAPTLVVKEAALAGQKFDGEIIPTGFPIIDEAIGGGIRRRGLHTIHGDEPQMFGESLAMRLGEKASVALITPFNHCCNPSFSSYHGDVTVIPIPFQSDMLVHLMQTHDAIVLLNSCPYLNNHANTPFFNSHKGDTRILRMLADKEDCAIVWVSFIRKGISFGGRVEDGHGQFLGELLPLTLAYMSDVVLCVQDQLDKNHSTWDRQFQYHFGRIFTLCLTKNRWSNSHVVEPVVLNDGMGFRPMCETNYWEYDRETGIIKGPWDQRYCELVRPPINEKPYIVRSNQV